MQEPHYSEASDQGMYPVLSTAHLREIRANESALSASLAAPSGS
jgi:hypothetical protein